MGRRLVWCKFTDFSEQSAAIIFKPENTASRFPSSQWISKITLNLNFHSSLSLPAASILISAQTSSVLNGHTKQGPTWELVSAFGLLPQLVCHRTQDCVGVSAARKAYNSNSFIFCDSHIFLTLLLFSPTQDGEK
jgi:hypothetical protein